MRPKGTAGELEVRRMIAARLLEEGRRVREVARIVGAAPSAVSGWKATLRKKGREGLKAKPHPGRKPRLSQRQKERLVKILLKGARKAGYSTELWTCPRVAEVIEQTFGVTYHPDHVWHILRKLGWSCQKPERRARERKDEEAIQRWRREDWPRIKKSPEKSP